MRRVGPPHLVQVRVQPRIGLGRGYQPASVVLVDRHLLGQQEPRAQPRRLGTQGEHGGDAAGVADAARRDVLSGLRFRGQQENPGAIDGYRFVAELAWRHIKPRAKATRRTTP